MKLVKLNRRHKAHKEYGHQWAFRWDGYEPVAVYRVEKILQSMHGSQYSYNHSVWKSGFGCAPKGNRARPYWVSFTNEQDATVVLLQVQE
jgi:hypothetical protein